MIMSIKRNHHTVPQCYLRRFCRGDSLWVYDKKKGNYWEQRPKEVAKKTHYYSFTREDGTYDTRVEDLLGIIEGSTREAFERVDAGLVPDNTDKSTLARFISYQMVRVPRFRVMQDDLCEGLARQMNSFAFGNIESARKSLLSIGRDESELDDETLNRIVTMVANDELKISVSKNFSLGIMLNLAQELGKYLHGMTWTVHCVTKNAAFITSDSPLSIIKPPELRSKPEIGVGLLTPGAIKIFPLGSSSCLAMSESGDRVSYKRLPRYFIRWVNIQVAKDADRFIMARDKELLQRVVKVADI